MGLTPQYGKTAFFPIMMRDSRKVGAAMLDYSPLWTTMKEKGISQYRLLKCGVDNKTLDTLKKGGNITLLTLEKICSVLDCTPNDGVRFTK